MSLSLIVAMSENRVIGRENRLPWRLPEDLRRFKSVTLGHTLIMGRKTFQSIGRPLPGRTSLVLSRDPAFAPEGATVMRSLEDALKATERESEVFVIGGASVFAEALPRARRLYLTLVHAVLSGDTYFPAEGLDRFRCIEDEFHEADERHAYPFSFRLYLRG